MAHAESPSRRDFIASLAAAAACTLRATTDAAEAAPPTRPNILFIMADDLGWTDLACFGSRYYETPRLDRLAAQGVRFTAAYTNGPNCAPTRACLMSGKYTPRHGIFTVGDPVRGRIETRKLLPPKNNTTLPTDEITVAEALKTAGYATAHMGKWHLGAPPTAGPKAQGFDVNIAGTHAGHPPTYFSPYRIKTLPDGPKGEYLTDRLTDEALQFIDAHKDKPFFLYLPHFAVHTPIQAKKALIAKYKAKPPAGKHANPTYAAMIESMDQGIGRILDKLDQLGIADRTVVVFTSDNGGVGGYRDAGIPTGDITHNAPLRGGKGMLYEGGIRVPLIVRWPGTTKPGTVCHEPVISLDYYPTLCDIAGARPPAKQKLDGESLVPLLKGAEKLRREAIFWHFPAYLQAGRGALRTAPAGAIRKGPLKLIEFFETGKTELYHLGDDIGERTDLAEKLPEKAAELHGLLVAWRKAVDAPIPQPNPKYDPNAPPPAKRRRRAPKAKS